MTTPTPRTDAELVRSPYIGKNVSADFARRLERELAAAQEARQLAEADAKHAWTLYSDEKEARQRAEALAESNARDAERYRYIKDDRRGKFVEALALRDAENWDAAIDSAKERANG